MELFAPAYYKEFCCIADRCRHSCCIGWEIDVDADTLAHYDALGGEYAQTVRRSIDRTDVPHFVLAAHDRCPHLDEHGLCRIITAYGEQSLCEICREHPRFYHDTPHGKEVGLGLSCEEACRIVLGSDDFARMISVGQTEGEPDADAFDATSLRERIYAVLCDSNLSYTARLQSIYDAFDVSPAAQTDRTWLAILDGLEYLDEAHRPLFSCYRSDLATPPAAEPYLCRALAYFIFRHCSDAYDAEDFITRLGLALFFERLLCSMIEGGADPYEAARILSEELEYSEDNTEAIAAAFL